MKKQILFFTALVISLSVFAQGHSMLLMGSNRLDPFNMQAIKSNDVEFIISRNGNDFSVSALRWTEDPCDSILCIKGKITFTGNTRNSFGQLAMIPEGSTGGLKLVVVNESSGKRHNIPVDNNNHYYGHVSAEGSYKYLLNGKLIGIKHTIKR